MIKLPNDQIVFMMYTLDQIKEKLLMVKPELMEKYYISELGVFGSFVRGEANSNSRIRVMANFSIRPGLTKFIGLSHELQGLFGIKVVVFDRDKIKSKDWEGIAKEIVYI